MFATDLDNESLKATRQFEKASIEKWIQQVRDKNKKLLALMAAALKEEPAPASESAVLFDEVDRLEEIEEGDGFVDMPLAWTQDTTLKQLQTMLDLDDLWNADTRDITVAT